MGWVLLAIVVVAAVVIWRGARRRGAGSSVAEGPVGRNADRGYADIEAQVRRQTQGPQGRGGYRG